MLWLCSNRLRVRFASVLSLSCVRSIFNCVPLVQDSDVFFQTHAGQMSEDKITMTTADLGEAK